MAINELRKVWIRLLEGNFSGWLSASDIKREGAYNEGKKELNMHVYLGLEAVSLPASFSANRFPTLQLVFLER